MGTSHPMQVEGRERDAFATITDLSRVAMDEIARTLRPLLADVFALYLKTKDFHWHRRGRHFRDYHLLLDEQGVQLFAMTGVIAATALPVAVTSPNR